MNLIFADTSYFIALTDQRDAFHPEAVAFSRQNTRPLVTTTAIILELGGYFSRQDRRSAFLRIIELLREDHVEIVDVDSALFERGIERFRQRRDQNWSLADCISFLIMEDRELHEALTSDEHFAQAGFSALLRRAKAGP